MNKSDRMECLCILGGIILKWILKMPSSDSGSRRVVGCGGDD